MSEKVKYKAITDKEFEQIILTDGNFSILVFAAEWSGNSEIMDSIMERISKEYDKDIQFFKADIEKQKSIAEFFNIFSIPTTLIVKNGEVVDLIRGLVPAAEMRRKLSKHIENSKQE
ncbi:MAG: thioredoxin family protein [Saprospiraceae bacterium]